MPEKVKSDVWKRAVELAKLTYAARKRRQGIVKSYFYLGDLRRAACLRLRPAALAPPRRGPCDRRASRFTLYTTTKEKNRVLSLHLSQPFGKFIFAVRLRIHKNICARLNYCYANYLMDGYGSLKF